MKPMSSRLAMLLASLALSLGAHAQNISVATGGTGGVYYPMGGGIASVLSKHVPGMQATAEVTGGSVDNIKLIATGKPYIGFSMTDAGKDAYRGVDKFNGNKVPLKTQYGNLYVEDAIPKATYRGMDTDNKQATVMNILLAMKAWTRRPPTTS